MPHLLETRAIILKTHILKTHILKTLHRFISDKQQAAVI